MAPKSVFLTLTEIVGNSWKETHNLYIVKSIKLSSNSITLRRVAAPGDIFVPGAGDGDAVAAALTRLLARPGEVAARVVARLEAAVVTLDGRGCGCCCCCRFRFRFY